ncbi:MAG: hypothetical protein ACLFQK_12290 [Fibrobacterota bacterium]
MPTVEACWYASAIYNLYGETTPRKEKCYKFLFHPHRGQEITGGFECGFGDDWNNYDHDARMQDTYCALKLLRIYSKEISDNQKLESRASRPRTDCINWIRSCMNSDGSFARLSVTAQSPVLLPGEMTSTFMAVSCFTELGEPVPSPENPSPAVSESPKLRPDIKAPFIDMTDARELQYFQRIALPLYTYGLSKGENQTDALGRVLRWTRAIFGSHTWNSFSRGRSMMSRGWGLCGTQAHVFCQLVSSIGVKSRIVFGKSDVNAEALTHYKDDALPRWTSYSSFSNEWGNHTWAAFKNRPSKPPPSKSFDTWSALDYGIYYKNGGEKIAALSPKVWSRFSIETLNYKNGSYKKTSEFFKPEDFSYDSPPTRTAYPGNTY